MLYFAISYFIILVMFALEIFVKSGRISRNSRNQLIAIRPLWILLALMYAFVGILTKDPLITDLICGWKQICLPPTNEWIIYVGLVGVLIWMFMIKPMTKDIDELKSESKKIDGRLSNVEGTLNMVRDNTDKLLKKALKV